LTAATWDAAENISRHLRNFRRNRLVLKLAAPAILAIVSFFVGRIASDRQRLATGSLNPVAQAAAQPALTHKSTLDVNQKTQIAVPAKSATTPSATSHLQVTDPETAATIAELTRHEMQTLQRAADYGDDEAALQLGMLYELGRGFHQSCRQAAAWVTRAAQQGNVAAQYNLGLRYRDGDGVVPDLQQAETWLRKAAAHKNLRAVRALAELSQQPTETSVSQIPKLSQPTTASP
jgi:TPR repeat protein